MSSLKNVWIAMAVVTVIAVGGYLFPKVSSLLGSVGTRFPNGLAVGTTATVTQNKLTIGNSGIAIGNAIFGSCTLTSDSSITATTTGTATCTTTGSLASDKVFIQLATSTTKVAMQYAIIGVFPGTDTTTVTLMNLTGQTAVPSATNGFGSSTPYWIVR